LQDLASFTNEMMTSKLNLITRILQFHYIQPPEAACLALNLQPTELVARMERARYVDDRPIAVEHWYAPVKYFPGIDKKMFKESGMEQSTYYMMMTRYNVQVTRTIDTVSAVGLEAHDAKILQVEPGLPALLRTRISYDSKDMPVNYASGVYLINLKFMMTTNKVVIHSANAYEENERV
jgi:GntR family transcriptional regulator